MRELLICVSKNTISQKVPWLPKRSWAQFKFSFKIKSLGTCALGDISRILYIPIQHTHHFTMLSLSRLRKRRALRMWTLWGARAYEIWCRRTKGCECILCGETRSAYANLRRKRKSVSIINPLFHQSPVEFHRKRSRITSMGRVVDELYCI